MLDNLMFKTKTNMEFFMMIATIVVIVLGYIIKKYKEQKTAEQYKSLASTLRLQYVEGECAWEKIYGEQSSLLLPGTKDKFVYNRMTGLFAGAADGEFCEIRGKILAHKGTGDFVMEYNRRRGKTHMKFDEDEYDEF
nr:hypothetical protein [Elusimicrobiales bacterium]